MRVNIRAQAARGEGHKGRSYGAREIVSLAAHLQGASHAACEMGVASF